MPFVRGVATRRFRSTVVEKSMAQDSAGFSTKVTALGSGYGIRVFRHGKLVCSTKVTSRLQVGPAIRDLLRWIDKSGGQSPMASASRNRGKRTEALTKITWGR